MCIVNPFDLFIKKNHKNLTFSLENKNLKGGEILWWNKIQILKYMLDTIIGTPRNSYE